MPGSGNGTPKSQAPPGTPTWTKVLAGLVAAVAALLFFSRVSFPVLDVDLPTTPVTISTSTSTSLVFETLTTTITETLPAPTQEFIPPPTMSASEQT